MFFMSLLLNMVSVFSLGSTIMFDYSHPHLLNLNICIDTGISILVDMHEKGIREVLIHFVL